MERTGLLITKYRWSLTLVVFAVTFLAWFSMPQLRIEENEGMWFSKNDPILVAYRYFQENFSSSATAVIGYQSDAPLSGNELTYLKRLCDKLDKIPQVKDITSITTVDDIRGSEYGLEISSLVNNEYYSSDSIGRGLLTQRIDINHLMHGTLIGKNYASGDKSSIGIILELKVKPEDYSAANIFASNTVNNIRNVLNDETVTTGKQFHLGGNIVTDVDVAQIIDQDMHTFFPLSLLFSAILLFLLFRSFYHVLFPVLSVVFALIWTLALKAFFDSPISPVSTTLFALITVMGVANTIHLISHFQIAIRISGDKHTALRETFRKAGKACFFTSFTTALGFSSLGISPLPVIRDMGLFASFGIMSAFVISLILVPVGLMQQKKPKVGREQKAGFLETILTAIGRFDVRHPKKILIAGFLLMAIMACGIPFIKVESSMVNYLTKESVLRRDAEFLDTNLTGISSSEIVIHGNVDDFKDPENLRKIDALQNICRKHPQVSMSHSIVDYVKLIYRALHSDSADWFCIPNSREAVAQSLLLYEMSGGEELENYVTTDYSETRIAVQTRQMKQHERESLLGTMHTYMETHFSEYKYEITGFDNLIYETTLRIVETEIKSIGLAFCVILITLCFLFGIKGGLISIIPNVFPIVFLLGFMGYAGFTLDVATSIIASIAIGIVVDDTIHYFFHYKHEQATLQDGTRALVSTHRKVGPALCFTSACLIAGFCIFLFSNTHILINYGLLSGVAVLVALFGDLFFGPVLLWKLKAFEEMSD
ncbi:MAG: MMPL family transporter [Fibrobacteria bacterium]|nr:MMPL family transporter [Fibrobacteria bacterium]